MTDEHDAVERIAPDQADTEYPYTALPDWVAMAPVSDLAKVAYWLLSVHADKTSAVRKSFPGKGKIARLVGLVKTQPIGKAIDELVAIGAVTYTTHGRRTVYVTYPRPRTGYDGPRRTSDLSRPGVLDALIARQRPRRSPSAQAGQAAPDPPDDQVRQVRPDEPDTQVRQVEPERAAAAARPRHLLGLPRAEVVEAAEPFDWWAGSGAPAAAVGGSR